MLKSENVEEKKSAAVKMSHAIALEYAINYMKDDNNADPYVEDLQKLLATYVKRSTERKPGKREKEAAAFREEVITYLRDHPDEEFDAEEIYCTILNPIGYPYDYGNPEPMLRQAVKAGIVDKRKVNGYTYWSIHVADDAGEEA